MSRLRSSLTPVILAVAVLGTALSGCIFNPDKPKIQPPGASYTPAKSEAELIGQLKTAYQKKDYDTFQRLFHPDYQFYLNDPVGEHWGLREELRIHHRMFRPSEPTPPDPDVRPELWLVSVDIALTARDAFQGIDSYYYDAVLNPGGLHPQNFTVTQTDYVASLFFQLQGDTQYKVDGTANFVVVNDLAKTIGEDGKFLIYRWEDLGAQKPSPTPAL